VEDPWAWHHNTSGEDEDEGDDDDDEKNWSEDPMIDISYSS
jgi:hypothetical protein